MERGDRDLHRIELRGVAIQAITERHCAAAIFTGLEEGRGGMVVTVNLDHLRRCVGDERYAATVAAADLVVADGMPLVWASRIQGDPLPERVTGSDLVWTLARHARDAARTLFLLGGDPGTATRAAEALEQRFPGLRVAGTSCPVPGFEEDPEQMQELTRALSESDPDIVYVALGSPKQEYLIESLRSLLPRSWFLGVGISFSFICGEVSRAPGWVQKVGMEWAHRLAQEPRRLARRYLVQGLPFAGGLMLRSALRRFRRQGPP